MLVEDKEIGFEYFPDSRKIEIRTHKPRNRLPNIKASQPDAEVLFKLAMASRALTGNQVQLIREYLDYSVCDFAKLLGVSHPSIINWQNKGNKQTGMGYSKEFLIRSALLVALSESEKVFYKGFTELLARGDIRREPRRTQLASLEPPQLAAVI